MSRPINEIDYQRFLKLAKAIKDNKHLRSQCSPGTSAELNLYSSTTAHEKQAFISIEMRGLIPEQLAEEIFNDLDLSVLKI